MINLEMQQLSLIEEIRNPPGKDNCLIKNSHIYSQLIFNKINQSLQHCYPLSQILLRDAWPQVVTQFIAEYECYSPYFYDIPKQFCDFILTDYLYFEDFPDNLYDLIYFEWLQYDLLLRPLDKPKVKAGGINEIRHKVPQASIRSELWNSHWNCHLFNDPDTETSYSEQAYQFIFGVDINQNVIVFEASEDTAKLYDFISVNMLFDSYQVAEEFCILMKMDTEESIQYVLEEIFHLYQKRFIVFNQEPV